MNELKATPGPWEIVRFTNYHGWSVNAPDRGCIAERWYDSEQKAPYDEELRANAHLIAEAPVMYDMLATIENDDGKIPDWLWSRIQDTLARARGES